MYPEAGTFNGEVFEKHPYAWPEGRGFYERFMRGEKPQAGWVSESDFEKQSIPHP